MSVTYRYRYRREPEAIGPETITLESYDENPADIIKYDSTYYNRYLGRAEPIIGNYRRIK